MALPDIWNGEPSFMFPARPIWIRGKQREKNVSMGLYTLLRDSNRTVLRIAACSFYRVFVNGEFFFYGPSRCAHGFFRVDELELPANKELHIAIEVVNYYINTYEYPCQPGFVIAEITDGNQTLAATGNSSFSCLELVERKRKVQRYSCQRGFVESYELDRDYADWRIGKQSLNARAAEIEITEKKNLLPRIIPLNVFSDKPFLYFQSKGRFDSGIIPDDYYRHRSLLFADDPKNGFLDGFHIDDLDCCLSDEVQRFKTVDYYRINEKAEEVFNISDGDFSIASLESEKTGFLCAKISCIQPGNICFLFDEILDNNGDVDPFRLECTNIIKLDLQAGDYNFQSVCPYGMKYLKIMAFGGLFAVSDLNIKEFVCPSVINNPYKPHDKKLNLIFNAAKETFLQNSPDILMDCPTRERAGWLCDSYFSSIAEKFFTGSNIIEKNFLYNYLLPKEFDHIPCGMLPMCYPADHPSGRYIPNWSLWLIIELHSHLFERGGEREFVLLFKDRVYKILDWFSQYENADGLLEKLPGWVFVEWSKANECTNDINYPTNMLYYAALKSTAQMFDDRVLLIKAEALKETILARSFDGEFFTDNEVYNTHGKAIPSGNHTETCQYYAFFFGIATPDEHPILWKRLVDEFGPKRNETESFPDVYPSNAFIGNYLRLFVLERYGLHSVVLEEIIDYFYYMAEKTGTLWEHTGDYASCNHGFASSIAKLIYDCEKGSVR